jgi:MSHA biogenesis protein MshL
MENKRFIRVVSLLSVIGLLGGCSTIDPFSKNQDLVKDNIYTIQTPRDTKDSSLVNNKETVMKPENVSVKEGISPIKKEEVLPDRFNFNVDNAPVDAVLTALVNGSSYSLVLPEKLSGKVTLNLKNVTCFDVLQLLKNVYNYDYSVNDHVIIVYPNGLMTKVFTINHLVGTRKGRTDVKVRSSSLDAAASLQQNSVAGGLVTPMPTQSTSANDQQNQTTEVISEEKTDFWKDLSVVLEDLIGKKEGRFITVSQQMNTIVVRAMPNEINEVEKYLTKIQAIVNRQVIIEAKIIEVQLNNGEQSGINWAAFNNGSNRASAIGFGGANSNLANTGTLSASGDNNVTATPGSSLATGSLGGSATGLFSLAFQTNNFASLLNFLQTQGELNVLSSPRIATMNNQRALLKVGTDEYYVTNVTTVSSISTFGTTNTPSVTTAPFFSGIALDITTQIDEGDMVTMHIHPLISNVSTVTQNLNLGSLGTLVLPLAASQISETDSVVRVESNKIVAIGGLMKQATQNNNSQIPGLGNAPGIGILFGNNNNAYQKYELVILLKANIINNTNDWEVDLNKIKQSLADFKKFDKDVVIKGDPVVDSSVGVVKNKK